jgi:hypothetical protein
MVKRLLMGGIIGTIAGLLLAPRAGSDVRRQLAERTGPWRTAAVDMAGQVRRRVGPMIEQFRSRNGGEPDLPVVEEQKETPEVGVRS